MYSIVYHRKSHIIYSKNIFLKNIFKIQHSSLDQTTTFSFIYLVQNVKENGKHNKWVKNIVKYK